MARTPRLVVPGVPHHVTQRGARRMPVFFSDDDYLLYLRILSEQAKRHETECLCHCLMPNHVHLVAVPTREDSLALTFGEAHRRFAWIINQREGWRGHLWQERFFSCPMSDSHLYNTARYVLTNPVRAGLVDRPHDWPHSSVRTHLDGQDDSLARSGPLATRILDWEEYLRSPTADFDAIRACTRTGRPLGGDDFVRFVEKTTGRNLQRRPPGPKPRH